MNDAADRPLRILIGLFVCTMVFWARFAYLYNIPGQSPSIVIKPDWFSSVYVDAIDDEGSFFSSTSKTVVHQYKPIPFVAVLVLFGLIYYFTAQIVMPTLLRRPPPIGPPGARR